MSLTLSQFLHLILTFAAVVGVTFLVLYLIQLRKTAREAEKALMEFRELVVNLNSTNQKVNQKIDELGSVFEATRKAATGLSQASMFFSNKVMRPTFRYWPIIIPLLRLVMRQRKKKKEAKNGY
jgi:hypothetical protein